MVNPKFTGPRRGLGLAAALTLLTGFVSFIPILASAQTSAKKLSATPATSKPPSAPPSTKPWVAPHTKWGDPDLQGVWEGFESVPLERPLALGDKEFFTDAELADRVAKAAERAKAREALIAEGKVEHQGFRAVPNYNAIFEYSEPEGTPHISKRTSAIVDPPNGRLPPWTLEQVKYWEAREAATKGRGESDTMDDINLATRRFRRTTFVTRRPSTIRIFSRALGR